MEIGKGSGSDMKSLSQQEFHFPRKRLTICQAQRARNKSSSIFIEINIPCILIHSARNLITLFKRPKSR